MTTSPRFVTGIGRTCFIPAVGGPSTPVVLLDAAVGTELARRGASVDGPAWSARALVEAPDLVLGVHADHVAAGAQVLVASTFRATGRALRAWRDVDPAAPDPASWRDLVGRAVGLARAAASSGDRPVRVLGGLAPLEDCFAPDRAPDDPRAEHAAMAAALAEAGVDGVLCETFASAREAPIAVEEAARTGLPVWASLTAGPDGSLLDPSGMRRVADACVARGASVVLVGCTPARDVSRYLAALRGAGVPVGVKANAGAPRDAIGTLPDWGPHAFDEGAAAARFAALAIGWREAGASAIGGCCGITPAMLAAARHALVG